MNASVSPRPCRRSLWPTMTYWQPTSREHRRADLAGEGAFLRRVEVLRAEARRGCPRGRRRPARRYGNGGQTATVHARRRRRRRRRPRPARCRSAASVYIFQLPAMNGVRAIEVSNRFTAVSAEDAEEDDERMKCSLSAVCPLRRRVLAVNPIDPSSCRRPPPAAAGRSSARRTGAAAAPAGRRTAPSPGSCGPRRGRRRPRRRRRPGPSPGSGRAGRSRGSGSTMIGRWLWPFTFGTALMSSMFRVESSKRPHAALAQHHVRVALGQDVLGRHQQVLHRRAHAALEQHRLAASGRPP